MIDFVSTGGLNDGQKVKQDGSVNKYIDWCAVKSEDFWTIADELQSSVLEKSNSMFSYLQTADIENIRKLLIQYRFFTIYYNTDLALLVSKLGEGKLRSFLGEILSDELGNGDASKSHPKLYDNFLESIGVETSTLDEIALASNIMMLNDIRRLLVENNPVFGVGLRGMGGECVCQVYITQLYEHLIKNPYIIKNREKIDWVFWDLHVGEHDVEHRLQTRQLIHDEIVSEGEYPLVQLGYGYEESMKTWGRFWENIFLREKEPYNYTDLTTLERPIQICMC